MPIVGLTADGQDRRGWALSLGCTDAAPLPSDRRGLVRAVRSCLAGAVGSPVLADA